MIQSSEEGLKHEKKYKHIPDLAQGIRTDTVRIEYMWIGRIVVEENALGARFVIHVYNGRAKCFSHATLDKHKSDNFNLIRLTNTKSSPI